MKGRPPTVEERQHMDRVAELGCIVCRIKGFPNVPAEIHHIHGRTKQGCHLQVLPLCFEHHRQGSGAEPISRHPYKRRFEAAYGSEEHLLTEVESVLRLNQIHDLSGVGGLKFEKNTIS